MRARSLVAGLIVLSLSTLALADGSTVVYVDDDARPGGDGASWETALRFLSDGLDAAVAVGGPAEVRVGQGRYQPDQSDRNPAGTGDREATFDLADDVAVRGGFGGVLASDPNARDTEKFFTLLSGELNGAADGGTSNCYHVVRAIDVGVTGELDGFTIKHGNADGPCCDPPSRGGGLYVGGGAPTIIDCVFEQNSASGGGGVAVLDGMPELRHCRFIDNFASTGGGLYAAGFVGPTVVECVFSSNLASNGGGIYLSGEGLEIVGSLFESNHATSAAGGGGAMRVAHFGRMTVSGTAFFGNTTGGFGGAMYAHESDITVDDCLFTGNTAVDGGGALFALSGGHWTVLDSSFVGNIAGDDGGAMRLSAPVTLVGAIVSNNQAGGSGGGLWLSGDGSILDQCDISLNTARNSAGVQLFGMDDLLVTGCTFLGNATTDFGAGGVGFAFSGSGEGVFVECSFLSNRARNGAGIIVDGTQRFIECDFQGNVATEEGGAVEVVDDATAIFESCAFYNNLAVLDGGAVFADRDSTLRFDMPEFINNTSTEGDGGAIFGTDATVVVHGGSFFLNEAVDGGALRMSFGSLTLVGTSVHDNGAVEQGGGFCVTGGSTALRGCTLEANGAGSGGAGAVDSFGAVVDITGCTVIGNTAEFGGGFSLGGGSTTIENTVLAGNVAGQSGGAVYSTTDGSVVVGCTVHANHAAAFTGGLLADGAAARVNTTNTIVWNNVDVSGTTLLAQIAGISGAIATLSHCCVQELPPDFGFGNIADDPAFADPLGKDGTPGTADDDLRLTTESPCVDAGLNTAVNACLADLDGNMRRADEPAVPDTGAPRDDAPYVDMGAYERNGAATDDCNGNGVLDGCDLGEGASADCDRNGVPDECDIAAGASDCDGNGVLDVCDIAGGAADCNGNGLLDVCEVRVVDCNGNGIPDDCDVSGGARADCNGNGVPDACDIAAGTVTDCNANGLPDVCEIADGSVQDCNGNGTPDSCEVDGPFAASSGVRSPVGNDVPINFVLGAVRASAGTVVVDVDASADLDSSSAVLKLYLNGTPFAQLFRLGATPDCADPPLRETVMLSAAAFNTLVTPGEDAVITVQPFGVNGGACDGMSTVEVSVAYDAIGSNDDDGDGVPDDCRCPADIDLDGDVGFTDLLAVLAAWGPCEACAEDIDGDGDVGFTDLLTVLARWGACPG